MAGKREYLAEKEKMQNAAAATADGQKFGYKWTTGSLAKAETKEEYERILGTLPNPANGGRLGAGNRLKDFGYFYNEEGQLRQIADPSKPFAWLGQKHYDFLGEAIVEEIYNIMQQKYGLRKLMLPFGPDSDKNPPSRIDQPRIPIFVSNNWKNCETLVFICQGIGAVRPGMWARALCINNSLKEGSIFSYLEWALARGFGVVVANPNENSYSPISVSAAPPSAAPTASAAAGSAAQDGAAPAGNDKKEEAEKKKDGDDDDDDDARDDAEKEEKKNSPILAEEAGDFWLGTSDAQWKVWLARALRGGESVTDSEDQETHGCEVWEKLVEKSCAKNLVIVAHSYGGKVTTAIADEFFESSVRDRVACVALTDAINDNFKNSDRQSAKEISALRAWFRKNSRNYVASEQPVGTPCPSRGMSAYEEVSAGHRTHEWTSAACAEHLFEWVEGRLALRAAQGDGAEGSRDGSSSKAASAASSQEKKAGSEDGAQ